MLKIILLSCIFLFLSGFSGKTPEQQKAPTSEEPSCSKSFKKELKKAKDKTEKEILSYVLFSCHPKESLDYLLKHHHDENWIFSELPKQRIRVNLKESEELWILTKLFPFLSHSSQIEKSLVRQIEIKKNLNLDFDEEQALLYSKFPSHDPEKLKHPSLSLAKDLRRRGQNRRALKVLSSIKNKDLTVFKNLVSTQKNIRRNQDYLSLSQQLTDYVSKKLKKNPRSSYLQKIYLKEALLNIRRVWTYRSTEEALSKLTNLIKSHCTGRHDCSEHYWIKGRIYEELNNPSRSLYWYKKAVENTSTKNSEYTNRVWNLAWLLYKSVGRDAALQASRQHFKGLQPKDIPSRHYYWMHEWERDPDKKVIYKNSIKTFHPMSFYLWSDLALGDGLNLEYQPLEDFTQKVQNPQVKKLLKIINSHHLSLAHSYIKFAEKKSNLKSLSWKRAKALSGKYLDLLLDLEAGLIDPKENLQYFYSRGFEQEVTVASSRFAVPKELIWSITRQESNFDPFARSWADAFGLMQILPKRAIEYFNDVKRVEGSEVQNVNPFKLYNPDLNTLMGAWLLRKNLNKFKQRLPLAIAAYNASESKVKDWEERFYKSDEWVPFIEEITYRETQKYVRLVLRNLAIYHSLEKAALDKKKLK